MEMFFPNWVSLLFPMFKCYLSEASPTTLLKLDTWLSAYQSQYLRVYHLTYYIISILKIVFLPLL